MVEFGLAIGNFTAPDEKLEFDSIVQRTRKAERLGFDSIWVYDHLLLGAKRVFPILESLTTIAALATIVPKIKLGTSILVLPLREPLLLAKVVSTIHHISKGRLILGVAAGWYEREFQACGVNFSRRGTIMEQNFLILRRLLSEDDISTRANGREYQHVTIAPRPDGGDGPKILMGGYVEGVLRRVGRLSDGWLSYYYTPNDFSKSWQKVQRYAKESGRDISHLDNANMLPICVASTVDEGTRKVNAFTGQYMDLPSWSEAKAESAIVGTIDQCEKQIQMQIDAGVCNIILIPAFYKDKQIEIIGTELLPRFRRC